jgi:hypothetical protein
MHELHKSVKFGRLRASIPHSLRSSRKVDNSQNNTIFITQAFCGLLDWIVEFIVVRGWEVVRFPQDGEVADTTQYGYRLDLAICYYDGFASVVVARDNPARVGEAHARCHGCENLRSKRSK